MWDGDVLDSLNKFSWAWDERLKIGTNENPMTPTQRSNQRILQRARKLRCD